MNTLPPLRFQPIFRRYMWGGRKLATLFGKPTGDETCAESWEVSDHADDQSIVQSGPLAGKTLRQLVEQHGRELLGRHYPQPRFPLLYKFLDANQKLSVQVHPNNTAAAILNPPDYGKTEAWVIVEAAPTSLIYAGLKRGFDRAALEREIARGSSELCLHRFTPHVGDCIFLRAGVVHAMSEGIVVAEIQQSSDTTFRLFDWNRPGPDGKLRTLHIDQALAAIDFSMGPVSPVKPQQTENASVERLVTCDEFILDRWQFHAPEAIPDDDCFHILSVLSGQVTLESGTDDELLESGATVLLPARRSPTRLIPRSSAIMLDAYLP